MTWLIWFFVGFIIGILGVLCFVLAMSIGILNKELKEKYGPGISVVNNKEECDIDESN